MESDILHAGFDGLKFTVQTDIPDDLREELVSAKRYARENHAECSLRMGKIALNVTSRGARGFTCHTGETGAVWLFQDPQDRVPNNPGFTVDFRALGLATGGLAVAEEHFRDCMHDFGIKYVETQLRVTRADFAVDFLAPCFEPDRTCLVVPPGTGVTEYSGPTEAETHSCGTRVTGLRAGAVANRQIAIYDKRSEVIRTKKRGWLTIWNAERRAQGKPPLDLSDQGSSLIWRFELRLGSKQLRNRFELRNWTDVHDMIGDPFADSVTRIRYCVPTGDSNRSRWPKHELWRSFEQVVRNDLKSHRCGVLPSDVIEANRAAKMRELDAQLGGLFVTRAAISDVDARSFPDFLETHVEALARYLDEHPRSLEERLERARSRFRMD